MVKLTRKSVVMKIRKKPPQEEFVSQAVRTGGDGQDAQEIAFIDNALFHADHAEDELFGEGSERIEVADWHFISPSCLEADGPPIKTKVLTPKQEKLLFLRYNYARRRNRQAQIRGAIRGTFESLMIWRQRAQDARDALVNANMALVPAMLRRVNCPNVELEELISEGKLPHLAALGQHGCFKPLAATDAPSTPVAWSSFQTGVNPDKHNLADVVAPEARSCQPAPNGVQSRPFWSVLSEHGVFSCILRVPPAFPPQRFRGVQLSAIDVRGAGGTFSYYTTKPRPDGERIGDEVRAVARCGDIVRAELAGPRNPRRADRPAPKIPFTVTIRDRESAVLKIAGARHELRQGRYTDWIKVRFRRAPGVKARGLCRFLLLGAEPEFQLYATPVHVDPESPAMPISHPAVYSVYLAKRQGPFATLGLAEDARAHSERILDDEHFIEQCLEGDREREAMFFDALDKVDRGLVVCVFDGADLLQRAFRRDIDGEHPVQAEISSENSRSVIEDQYRRMDDLVGRTVARCAGADARLLVISAYGFSVNRSLLPGVLFSDRPVEAEAPRLIDIGPTVLNLFGVPVPEYMDGQTLRVGETANISPAAQNDDLPGAI